jgi:hypothetical protein
MEKAGYSTAAMNFALSSIKFFQEHFESLRTTERYTHVFIRNVLSV